MRNIFKIFFADVKRISTNVVAVVVILGLCILPSLYAWFNILSNWDRTDRPQPEILRSRWRRTTRESQF